MLKNYFKIAFRNLTKNPGYSAINIGAFAVGMAVLIGLWIYDELSFSKASMPLPRVVNGPITPLSTMFTP